MVSGKGRHHSQRPVGLRAHPDGKNRHGPGPTRSACRRGRTSRCWAPAGTTDGVRLMLRHVMLAAIAGAVAGAIPAAAELQHTTTYKDHRVLGATTGELWRYMIA